MRMCVFETVTISISFRLQAEFQSTLSDDRGISIRLPIVTNSYIVVWVRGLLCADWRPPFGGEGCRRLEGSSRSGGGKFLCGGWTCSSCARVGSSHSSRTHTRSSVGRTEPVTDQLCNSPDPFSVDIFSARALFWYKSAVKNSSSPQCDWTTETIKHHWYKKEK